jgi:hypothetical protein
VDIPDALFKQEREGLKLYQRTLPLKPGPYKIDIVVKDMNSGNAGAVTKLLQVPRWPDEKLQLSSLVVAHRIEPLPASEVGTGMFAISGQKIWPNVTSEFRRNRDKNVNLYFQVYNLKVDNGTKKPSATLEIVFTRNNQEVKRIVEQSSDLANAASQMTVFESIPTSDLDPGQYGITVRVTDNFTKEVIVGKDAFVVR